jgi:hypothetical protein
MPAVGGSIQSITIKGRIFPVASDAEANKKLGGFENEVQANGDGTARKVMTRVPWAIDGLQVEINDDKGDHEFLQEIADLKDYVSIEMELASGTIYVGTGTITDEIQSSSQNATATIKVGGPGKLEAQ